MLCGLLLKELTIPTFCDNLHCLVLGCGPVEFVSEDFADD
jgi:hypothetical protein